MKKTAWLLSIIIPLACPGCVADSGDDDEDQENEPEASTAEALSAVSCSAKSVTGYKSGSPYAMSVVNIGGKPTAKPTAHAFLKMQAAAEAAGVRVSINSGFRSQAEQQYLYNCYKTRSCNNGNLAARPGYSNHQNGRALDLATDNWTWVGKNASRFGFAKTVPSERWHYEFNGSDPGGPCSGGSSAPAPSSSTSSGADDANDVDDNGGAGCHSATLGKKVEEGACVQSRADDVFYQCHAGLWYRGVSGGKGRYGACTSTHEL